jgi:uncharacterized protein YbaP (TraB family)
MSILAAEMPKSKDTKRVEAHLNPDKYAQIEALAKERQWSVKKMTENIILWYLESLKPKKGS